MIYPSDSATTRAQKHLKIKGTRNHYFKTIGYCSRTKVKIPLILRDGPLDNLLGGGGGGGGAKYKKKIRAREN